MRSLLLTHRHKIAVFGLLALASLICLVLFAARSFRDAAEPFGSLAWNLFLAWIPFLLSSLTYAASFKKPFAYIILALTAGLWLLFFPNAPYILTDLQHLAGDSTTAAPLWYDVIMLTWFSWTGLLLGLVSLYLMHDVVRRMFGRAAGWIFVFLASGLGSFGVYLGRFSRFNSWDILNDPKQIAVHVLGLAVDPSRRLLAFTLLFAVFYLFVYLILYSFTRITREEGGKLESH